MKNRGGLMSENTMNNLKIGVDVGGTKIEAVLVDAMGTVLGSARIPARHGNDAVIEDIVAVAHQAAGERFDEVRAIGVGTPGTVDSASGHVGNIVNLDVVSLDMGPLISQRSGVPAHVENDVNAAAVGAATVLGGADGMAGTIAFLNFGTGLAAGIVENGVLMHGYSGAAGEIGHISIDLDGPLCPCGKRGCLETMISGTALKKQLSAADVEQHQNILARAGRYLGQALSMPVGLLDMADVCVYGQPNIINETFIDAAQQYLDAATSSSFHKHTVIRRCECGPDITVQGEAIAVVFQHLAK